MPDLCLRYEDGRSELGSTVQALYGIWRPGLSSSFDQVVPNVDQTSIGIRSVMSNIRTRSLVVIVVRTTHRRLNNANLWLAVSVV
jgi:hypothetical protein